MRVNSFRVLKRRVVHREAPGRAALEWGSQDESVVARSCRGMPKSCTSSPSVLAAGLAVKWVMALPVGSPWQVEHTSRSLFCSVSVGRTVPG